MAKRFGRFIESPELGADVVIYNDVFVCALYVENVFSDEFLERAGIIRLDKSTMKHLSVKAGDGVSVSRGGVGVVVRAEESEYVGAPAMPKSPLSLMLTDGCDTRHFSATLKKATEPMTTIETLIEGMR
ncbi:MAG: formylmethanofuran dehydrogenase [Methermicoccaceae archaeon]